MSRTWAGGSTRQWRRTRATVLARDGYRCRAHTDGWCARAGAKPHTCTGRAPLTGPEPGHAHHTRGRHITGDDPTHIVAACAPCNQAIGDPTKAQTDPEPNPKTRW